MHQARIVSSIFIRRPIEQVFTYLTTPANWPQWHPASRCVSGTTGHSLECGEQVTEDYEVAGRPGRAIWTVRERHAPTRWVIEGQAESGGTATITYTLTPESDGTAFERELLYTIPRPLGVLLDRLLWRRRVRQESTEALRRLKQVLESGTV
jgi:uncharacterized protein YndB with AHSA1/START domain